MVIFLSVTMLIGSFVAGWLPLALTLSEVFMNIKYCVKFLHIPTKKMKNLPICLFHFYEKNFNENFIQCLCLFFIKIK